MSEPSMLLQVGCFYNENKDFKKYVDKYAIRNHTTSDVAIKHQMVIEAYKYYKEKGELPCQQ